MYLIWIPWLKENPRHYKIQESKIEAYGSHEWNKAIVMSIGYASTLMLWY